MEDRAIPQQAEEVHDEFAGTSPEIKLADYYPNLVLNLRNLANLHSSASTKLSVEEFLGKSQCIRSAAHKGVLSRIEEVLPADSSQIKEWYEANTSDQPTYADDPKWKEWWINTIERPEAGLRVFKLNLLDEAVEKQILGVIALKLVNDWNDGGRPVLYVNGLRINPNLMPHELEVREYHGVGKALLTFALVQSIRSCFDGIGLNSSLGVEGYYEKLGMNSMAAYDGKRKYFTVKGEQEISNFLTDRYLEALLELA